ncbi:MAG: cobalamin biosynthesis protein CobD [Chloroflexi bacterium]|nr:cobalamin biosynthesis protein CobD [Chloroflexota bacterium]
MSNARALPMIAALALDAVLGEPPDALHPVVWIGTAAGHLERRAPRHGTPALLAGAAIVGLTVGGSALTGLLAQRMLQRLPWPLRLLVEAWLLKTTLSVRALLDAGHAVEEALADDDLDVARQDVRALVSRDPTGLTATQLTSAAIESLAENTADSIVAPLVYYRLGGLPAAFAYRAANTLDAMIGYRGEYEHLGKAAARLDDLLNLVPARLSSVTLLVSGAIFGGAVPTGVAITVRDHRETASPNAGWPMSTMAGLLFARLEKPGHYVLGDDLPAPDISAIDHAAQIVAGAAGLTVPLAAIVGRLVDSIRRLVRCW